MKIDLILVENGEHERI